MESQELIDNQRTQYGCNTAGELESQSPVDTVELESQRRVDTGELEEQSPVDTGDSEEQSPVDTGDLEEQRRVDAGDLEEQRPVDTVELESQRQQHFHTWYRQFELNEYMKSLSQVKDLEIHEWVHSGEKPFTCNDC